MNRYVLVVLLSAMVITYALWGRGGGVESAQGRHAPDFQLQDLSGQVVRLSDYEGKVVVLAFWGHGCPPCREEAPHLSALVEAFDSKDVAVLAVNGWNEPPDVLADYVKSHGLKQRVLVYGAEVAREYEVEYFPTVVWVDRGGTIAEAQVGALGFSTLKEITRRVLEKN